MNGENQNQTEPPRSFDLLGYLYKVAPPLALAVAGYLLAGCAPTEVNAYAIDDKGTLPTPSPQTLAASPQVIKDLQIQPTMANDPDRINPTPTAKIEQSLPSPEQVYAVEKLFNIVGPRHPMTPEEIKQVEDSLTRVSDKDPLYQYLWAPGNFGYLEVDGTLGTNLLELMQEARTASGSGDIEPLIISGGFRNSWAQQTALNNVNGDTSVVMPPGQSQHHNGITFDFRTTSAEPGLSFSKTRAAKWLIDNAWKKGFIPVYAVCDLDGVKKLYETHHYLYVGKEKAEHFHNYLKLQETNNTLETCTFNDFVFYYIKQTKKY